jgi:hypothetical protein
LWGWVGEFKDAFASRAVKKWLADFFSEKIILRLWYGSGVIAFVFILTFYYPTMRYLIDSIPMLGLMAAAGGWQWMDSGRGKRVKPVIIFLLILVTVTVGFLLCINVAHDYFEQANPALYYHLIGFFKGQ